MNKNIQTTWESLNGNEQRAMAEFQVVKTLAEKIGYGNLIQIADCLWRNKSGPVCYYNALDPSSETFEGFQLVYDEWHELFEDLITLPQN